MNKLFVLLFQGMTMSTCGLHGCFLPSEPSASPIHERCRPQGATPKTPDEIRSQLVAIAEELEPEGERWQTTTAELKLYLARNLRLFESETDSTKQDLPRSLKRICRDGSVDFEDPDTCKAAEDIELIMSRLCGILEKRYPYLKQHSKLIPIGSFHDRTKIRPVDEFDYIYVITPDAGDIVSKDKETRVSQDLLQHVTRGSRLWKFLTDLKQDYPMDLRTMQYPTISAPLQAMRNVTLPKGWKRLPDLDLLPDSFHKQGPACTFWFQRTVDSQDIAIAADFTMGFQLNWDKLGLEADGENDSSRNLDALFPAVSDWPEQWKSRLVELIKEKGVFHLCLLASGEYLSLSHIEVDVLNHHISPVAKDVLRLLKILTKLVFTAKDDKDLFVVAMNRKLQSNPAFNQAVFRIIKQCRTAYAISAKDHIPESDIRKLVKAARDEAENIMSGVPPGVIRDFLNTFLWFSVYKELMYKVSNSRTQSRLFKALLGHAKANLRVLRNVACCSVGIEARPHLNVCSAALKYTFLSLIVHRWSTEQWQWTEEDVPKILVEVLNDFCERSSDSLGGIRHYITGHPVKLIRRRSSVTLDQGVQLILDVISGLAKMLDKRMTQRRMN